MLFRSQGSGVRGQGCWHVLSARTFSGRGTKVTLKLQTVVCVCVRLWVAIYTCVCVCVLVHVCVGRAVCVCVFDYVGGGKAVCEV